MVLPVKRLSRVGLAEYAKLLVCLQASCPDACSGVVAFCSFLAPVTWHTTTGTARELQRTLLKAAFAQRYQHHRRHSGRIT